VESERSSPFSFFTSHESGQGEPCRKGSDLQGVGALHSICTIGNLEAEVSSHVPCPTLTKVQERVRVIPHGGIMGGPVKVDSLMSNSTESQSPNMPVQSIHNRSISSPQLSSWRS